MIETPFYIEPEFTEAEFEKLGRLTIRWAHIDHVLGNCLRRLLKMSEEDAVVMVFPMSGSDRLQAINKLAPKRRLNKDAKAALEALNWVLPGMRAIRNNVVHTVVFKDKDGEHHFELRNKERRFSKKQVLGSEEITNYAAHAVLSFRVALGLKSGPARHPLPDRPAVPPSLRNQFQEPSPNRHERRRQSQRPSSRGSRPKAKRASVP